MVVNGIQAGDFENFPFADLKKTLSHQVVTSTTDFHGNKTKSYASAVNIQGIFMRKLNRWSRTFEGLKKDADAYMMVLPATTVARGDKITYNGETFEIDNVILRDNPVGVNLYKFCNLYLLQ